MTQLWYIAVFCVLISPYVRGQENRECFKAFETPTNHALDYHTSLNNGAISEGPLRNVSNREACLSACCNKKACDLAIVGTPQDGPAQCFLVSCTIDGKDVCRMRSLKQFTAYKKKRTTPKFEGKSADSTDCTAPMMVGHCRAALPRFFYNGTSCQPFLYGGCLGNSNNFETLDACQAACNKTPGAAMSNDVPSAPAARRIAQADTNASSPEGSPREMTAEDFAEHCQAKAMTGPCRASIPRYFYNGTTCQRFIFGGCKGNQNNYGSVEECQTTCTVTVIPSPRKAPEGNSSDNKDSCTAKQETGPCRGAFPSFYFDPATQSCLPFIYGGCQGNGNRFGSVVECMSRCSGQEGNVDTHALPPSRAPAYFLVATLAVISVVVLVGLLLVMLRRSTFRRRLRDDKEELLPEDQLATEQNA